MRGARECRSSDTFSAGLFSGTGVNTPLEMLRSRDTPTGVALSGCEGFCLRLAGRLRAPYLCPEWQVCALGTDRFLREIHFAARLHPHILPLHDIGWSTPRHGRSSMTCARTRGSSRCSAEWAFPDPSLPKFESLK